jgi:ribose transport system substrate-binding protein
MTLQRACRLSFAAVVAGSLLACSQPSGDRPQPGAAPPSKSRRIAVIPKGTTNEFWKSVHAGAVKAARDQGIEIVWKGPVREDDRDEQIKVVENFLSQGIDGIVLAPLDDRALIPVLNDAKARKIPVLILDSGVQWADYVSFVATDNEKAGSLAAERLGARLGGKGDVVLFRYQEGSASTMARETGFLTTLAQKFPGVRVISSNRHGGVTTETAYAASENLLSTYKKIDGIFCPNESTTFGMLLALDAARRTGQVKLVGFDASTKLVEALAQDKIDGLVVQDPFRMAELGVTTLLKHLKGEPVERRIDTGEYLITRENMNQPEMKALLSPDLAKYLN